MLLLISIAKPLRHLWRAALSLAAKGYLWLWGVQFGQNLRLESLLFCRRQAGAIIKLGDNVTILNTTVENNAGINRKTVLVASQPHARLLIGNNVGISGATIYCAHSVRIGDNVNLGANATIYDTDFHPVNYLARRAHDRSSIRTGAVEIGEDVWVGADAMILRGVSIGARSIIAARAVVTADVPPDSIVAGVPAQVVRHLSPG